MNMTTVTERKSLKKSTLCFILAFCLVVVVPGQAMATENYYVFDSVNTKIDFGLRVLGLKKITGEFGKIKGKAIISRDNQRQNFINITISSDSVRNDSTYIERRMKSDDFLNTTVFPTINFQSNSFEWTAQDDIVIIGPLTLHGITKEIKWVARMVNSRELSQEQSFYRVNAVISRSDFGMTKGLPFISDKITLNIEIQASLPQG
ncbi:YceI family protein [Kiloniella majae]|uniref:YceI family protein n=1 Tax=Kiloniella majae TaxID=1938558 RepID=UPI000A278809|nr:YceI family protein [Kiloniella majae]